MAPEIKNINQAFLTAMENYAENICLQVKRGKRYQHVSYRRFQTLTLRLIQFLQNRGIRNEERVAIVADNSLEWLVTYIATLLCGGIVVPLPASLSATMLQQILQDCDASMVILQNKNHINALTNTPPLNHLLPLTTLNYFSGHSLL